MKLKRQTKGGLDLRTGEKLLEILKCQCVEIEELRQDVDVDFI